MVWWHLLCTWMSGKSARELLLKHNLERGGDVNLIGVAARTRRMRSRHRRRHSGRSGRYDRVLVGLLLLLLLLLIVELIVGERAQRARQRMIELGGRLVMKHLLLLHLIMLLLDKHVVVRHGLHLLLFFHEARIGLRMQRGRRNHVGEHVRRVWRLLLVLEQWWRRRRRTRLRQELTILVLCERINKIALLEYAVLERRLYFEIGLRGGATQIILVAKLVGDLLLLLVGRGGEMWRQLIGATLLLMLLGLLMLLPDWMQTKKEIQLMCV